MIVFSQLSVSLDLAIMSSTTKEAGSSFLIFELLALHLSSLVSAISFYSRGLFDYSTLACFVFQMYAFLGYWLLKFGFPSKPVVNPPGYANLTYVGILLYLNFAISLGLTLMTYL